MRRMDHSSSGGSGASATASASSGSTGLQEAMDQRKRKRMLSNRESARRSRHRKQKHLGELTAQVGQLRRENGHVLAALAATARGFLAVESENAVLRAQAAELATRLRSLNDILLYMNACDDRSFADGGGGDGGDGGMDGVAIGEPWFQPVMNVALADMFQYC
ncbi:putative ocs element-binding factor 1 [Iris pallida]|uniref:Ocs element-binding factor 1 n=1 Tax=Iris pallida TaxID=29817 RepID=A0AAX6DUK3_IRIPA|nr:putative ocs element-binding factor 1 [Iris pallida]